MVCLKALESMEVEALRRSAWPSPLGILQLANAPFLTPGFVNSAETWGVEILTRQVAGAFVSRIVAQDPGIEAGYVAAAKELEARGAALILSNCGLTVLYQGAIADAVEVPVLTSSLLALPALQRQIPMRWSIGVLTYDKDLCNARLFDLIGADRAGLLVEGLNGSESYDRLAQAESPCDWPVLERDLMAAVDRLVAGAKSLSAILVECTTFCPLVDRIRQRTGLPVFDFVWFVKAHLVAYAADGSNRDGAGRSEHQSGAGD